MPSKTATWIQYVRILRPSFYHEVEKFFESAVIDLEVAKMMGASNGGDTKSTHQFQAQLLASDVEVAIKPTLLHTEPIVELQFSFYLGQLLPTDALISILGLKGERDSIVVGSNRVINTKLEVHIRAVIRDPDIDRVGFKISR